MTLFLTLLKFAGYFIYIFSKIALLSGATASENGKFL